ncbi:MAG: VanZ family protein [Firmicutes bacterium]|nr:VanZ family protein [Bacillota bacterium]MDY6160885.1 VanZ family protein [Candidatus Faecousia sp.]
MLSKKKDYIFCILFGAYIAAVLWITLFSRIGDGYRGFLLPFHSYVEILKGNRQFLLENIGNVILFIPLGVALKCSGVRDVKKAGLLASLLIEILQFTFALGTFECDDLIHNTLGAVIGAWCVGKIGGEIKLGNQMRRVILLSMVLCSAVPFGYQEVRHQKMARLAAIYDREDGAKNLLVLNGKNGYAWDTDVYVEYLNNGSIRITGESDKRSWWRIGEITLEPGVYSFSGLSGVEKNTVGLELETDNHRFVPDVGPVDEVKFTLEETTKLMVYVSVYDGCDCDVIATPMIYKEG